MRLLLDSQSLNPFAPVVANLSASGAKRNLERQLRRRAEILAAARRLLAEEGHDHFTLRQIADVCHVTVQTLYNTFGCRDDLLTSALNEHTLMMDTVAWRHANNPTFLLNLASGYCHTAIVAPHFLRELMRTAFSGKNPLLSVLQRYGAQIKATALRELARDKLLKPAVDVDLLATQIARINSSVMYEWSQHDDVDELRRQIISGNSLLLLASLAPAAFGCVEDWLDANPQKNWREAFVDSFPDLSASAWPTMN